MTTVTGRTKTGNERKLELERRGHEALLWIHSPEDDAGGYEILLPPLLLLEKLCEAGATAVNYGISSGKRS